MNDDPDEPESHKRDFKMARCRNNIVVRHQGRIYLAKDVSPHQISINGLIISTKPTLFRRVKDWIGTKFQDAIGDKL